MSVVNPQAVALCYGSKLTNTYHFSSKLPDPISHHQHFPNTLTYKHPLCVFHLFTYNAFLLQGNI